MKKYTLSPLAQSDIEDIWDFTAERWNVDQAEVYVRQIWEAIGVIADKPGLGQSCDDVRAGYQKWPVGSHILFYRVVADAIDVVRILHERMDVDRQL